jgi:hypothetical protein
MSHEWDNLVIGGTDRPRIILSSDNIITNRYFDKDLSGYTTGSELIITSGTPGVQPTFTRVSDEYSYGEYSCRIFLDNPNYAGTVSVVYNYGSNIGGRRFIVTARIKTKYSFYIRWSANSQYELKLIEPITADTFNTYYFLTTVPSNQTGTTLTFTFYCPVKVDFLFDHMYFGKIENDYIFPQPNESSLEFEKYSIGENRLWNGKIQLYDLKYVPKYKAEYKYLSAAYENRRQRLLQAKNLFVIPHMDVSWGYWGKWTDDFERKYAFSRFLGHDSDLEIEGSEYLYHIPENMSSGGVIYVEEDGIENNGIGSAPAEIEQ